MGLIVYPSKFTTRTNLDTTIISNGDISVRMLYGIYTARTSGSHSWKYQSMVLQSAIRLFGNIDLWIQTQRQDKNITGYNYKFLEETIAYIQGTPRTMSAIVWKDVMENYNSSYYSVSVDANTKRDYVNRQLGSTSFVLNEWVTQRNGFDDLITSLYVLFGGH